MLADVFDVFFKKLINFVIGTLGNLHIQFARPEVWKITLSI